MGDCKHTRPSCNEQNGYDKQAARMFGYKVGQTYTVNDVIAEVRKSQEI